MSRRDPVWISEPIAERRFGLKGPRAMAALGEAGLAVPAHPNSWAPLGVADAEGSWDVIARLGSTEFFLEESGAAPRLTALREVVERGMSGVYPVPREDTAIVLGGAAARQALAEVCNVDVGAAFVASAPPRPIYLTLMIGVGVLVLPQVNGDDGPIYRIWCDPSYGTYLWGEIEGIVGRITTEKSNERQ